MNITWRTSRSAEYQKNVNRQKSGNQVFSDALQYRMENEARDSYARTEQRAVYGNYGKEVSFSQMGVTTRRNAIENQSLETTQTIQYQSYETENYKLVANNDEKCMDVYIDGERVGAFFYQDLNIKRDQATGTEVLLSSFGTGAGMYNVIPMDAELKAALCGAMGCEELEVEPLTGYSVKTHRGTGIQYVMKDGAEGRGGKVLLRNEADEAKYNALAEEYCKRYPNLVSDQEAGRIRASLEICGIMERTETGIVTIGYDNISYNDNSDSKKNWSVKLTRKYMGTT